MLASMKAIEECLKTAFLDSIINLTGFCRLLNDFYFIS